MMKTIRFSRRGPYEPLKILHVEAEGAIVNIRIGLRDATGRLVTSVEILADDGWTVDGHISSRVIGPAEDV